MSWTCSIRYWALGPLDLHVFVHALDPKQRRFYEVGAFGHDWQLWPPRAVLDHRNEWTMPDDAALLAQIAHCLRLLEKSCA